MSPFENPVYVSRPSLPPLDSYAEGLKEIWSSKWLTNGGPILRRFEARIAALLGLSDVALFTNGALALQIALAGMQLEGEVITTPFSFAATSNSLAQCGLTPVFGDVEPDHLTLDPASVEALIGPRTSAILAVHVFGVPCDLERLQAIADRHGLALVYDAAHAFGTTIGGRSIAGFGDVTMFSFHATKLFHSIEGGALAFRDGSLKHRFEALCNHGLNSSGDVVQPGLNAKMSEFQALMGELMLPSLMTSIAHGAAIEATYRQQLSDVPGLRFLQAPPPEVQPNHCYMPVLVDEARFGLSADRLQAELTRYNVFARRYFYPLISDMAAYRTTRRAGALPCATDAVRQVLALPSYADLALEDVVRICDLIRSVHQSHRGAVTPALPQQDFAPSFALSEAVRPTP